MKTNKKSNINLYFSIYVIFGVKRNRQTLNQKEIDLSVSFKS